jgi:hypothetical protein
MLHQSRGPKLAASGKADGHNAWWCAWDDHFGGTRAVDERIEICGTAIRKFVPYIEDTVVGFRWDW